MKIQHLAVIFVIIILPISLILSSYTTSRIQTLNLQSSYDTKLFNSTYDAIKAFQINTINNFASEWQANSKIRDIEASTNTFFNSLQTNFQMNGYDKKALQEHVPALVYTLYDGYYIFAPYKNTLDSQTALEKQDQSEYKNGDLVYELKPYVYYSCRYKTTGVDVVVTYSLDSHVTINGMVNGQVFNESGYLLSSATSAGDYRGLGITTETPLTERIIVDEDGTGGKVKDCKVYKINGRKYYYDGSKVFTINNDGTKNVQSNWSQELINQRFNSNDSAVQFYKEAAEFKEKIKNSLLWNLKTSQAVDENGNSLSSVFGNSYIFKELDNTVGNSVAIEDSESMFNNHRLDVIKRSIERNLSIAINNFHTTSISDYGMPKLKDYEWDRIANNISVISFLQGLSIGGKMYNGYAVVNNNKNQEYVANDSIYIQTADGLYHRANDEDLTGNYLTNARGYLNIDFERKSEDNYLYVDSSIATAYYNSREPAIGCYKSIITLNGVDDRPIEEIMSENKNLAKIYYTALARERYGLYRREKQK